MSDKPKNSPIFDQLSDALEERVGSDRRKKDLGKDNIAGVNRRKGDRRKK